MDLPIKKCCFFNGYLSLLEGISHQYSIESPFVVLLSCAIAIFPFYSHYIKIFHRIQFPMVNTSWLISVHRVFQRIFPSVFQRIFHNYPLNSEKENVHHVWFYSKYIRTVQRVFQRIFQRIFHRISHSYPLNHHEEKWQSNQISHWIFSVGSFIVISYPLNDHQEKKCKFIDIIENFPWDFP